MAIRESTLDKYSAIVEVSGAELEKYQKTGKLLSPHIKIVPKDNVYEYATHIEVPIKLILTGYEQTPQSFRVTNYHYEPSVFVEDLTAESFDAITFLKLFKNSGDKHLNFIDSYIYLTKYDFIKKAISDIHFKLLFLEENKILNPNTIKMGTSFDRLKANNELNRILDDSDSINTFKDWVNFIADKSYKNGSLFIGREKVRAVDKNLAFKKFVLLVEREAVNDPPVGIDDVRKSFINFYPSLANAISDGKNLATRKKVDDLNYKAQLNLVKLEDLILSQTKLPKAIGDDIRSLSIDFIIKAARGEEDDSVLHSYIQGIPSYYYDKLKKIVSSILKIKYAYISVIYNGVLKI